MRKSKQRKQTRRKDTKAMISRKNKIKHDIKKANKEARLAEQARLAKEQEAVNIDT